MIQDETHLLVQPHRVELVRAEVGRSQYVPERWACEDLHAPDTLVARVAVPSGSRLRADAMPPTSTEHSRALWKSDDAGEWRAALDAYDERLAALNHPKLLTLDSWFRHELDAVRSRTPLGLARELVELVDWKMTRGKVRTTSSTTPRPTPPRRSRMPRGGVTRSTTSSPMRNPRLRR